MNYLRSTAGGSGRDANTGSHNACSRRGNEHSATDAHDHQAPAAVPSAQAPRTTDAASGEGKRLTGERMAEGSAREPTPSSLPLPKSGIECRDRLRGEDKLNKAAESRLSRPMAAVSAGCGGASWERRYGALAATEKAGASDAAPSRPARPPRAKPRALTAATKPGSTADRRSVGRADARCRRCWAVSRSACKSAEQRDGL